MTRPFSEYRGTPLWSALQQVLSELQTTRELRVETAPEYVIGFICRELAAKHIVTEQALAPAPGR